MSEFPSRYYLELLPLRAPAFEFLAAISVWADTQRSHKRLVMAYEGLRVAMEEVETHIKRMLFSGLDSDLLILQDHRADPSALSRN